MKLSFFIHGVPNGNDIWGEGDGRSYVQNFYNGQASPEQSKLCVEVLKNKNISYYTYLRERNIVSAEGRAGSYFGITIGFQNEFCLDFENLFKLFDLVYEKMIKSVLLVQVADNEKFLISRFSEKEDIIKNVQETLFSQIIKSFENDVVPLDSSFVGDSNGCIKSNILDVGSKFFILQFKRTLKVKISSDYPTKDDLLNSLKNTVSELKTKCAEVPFLNEKICNQAKEIESIEKKCREREKEIERLKKICSSKQKNDDSQNYLPVFVADESTKTKAFLNFISNLKLKSICAKYLTKEFVLMLFAAFVGIVVVLIIIL